MWGAPFDHLQPLISTLDDLYTHARMREIIDMGMNDAAHAQVRTEARDCLSEGQSTVAKSWLEPIVAEEGESGALFAIVARFNIEVNSLKDAYSHAALKAKLEQPVPVRRAWGVPGLMWALLLDQLEAHQHFQFCKRCGQLISGNINRRFCSEDENAECYRGRKRGDKRRSRRRNERMTKRAPNEPPVGTS